MIEFNKSTTSRKQLHKRVRKACRRGFQIERLEARHLLAAELAALNSIDFGFKDDPFENILGQQLAQLNRTGSGIVSNSAVSKFTHGMPVLRTSNGDALIEVLAKDNIDTLQSQLASVGFTQYGAFGKLVSGSIHPALLDEVAALSEVRLVTPVHEAIRNVGSVNNEADAAQRSDLAKFNFGLDGTGLKIGVLSDSYNTLNGAAGGIATGDLPGPGNPLGNTKPVIVLEELASGSGIDEGRAMIELIHDIVPKAELLFHSAFNGEASFAQGIIELANAGADVIVDDIRYSTQPFFQHGIVAQAANQVAAAGIPFFSSAGNGAAASYQSVFRSSGPQSFNGATYDFHDFDPGSGVLFGQTIVIPARRTLNLAFQWDQPHASSGGLGSANDLDLFILKDGILLGGSTTNNLNGNPFESIVIDNPDATPLIFQLAIGHRITPGTPTPGFIKYIDFKDVGADFQFDTNSSTITGHANTLLVAGVGASDYRATPAFGTNPALPESFTSLGGTPILFDTAGNRFSTPVVPAQPRFTAPDNTNTTFFTSGNDPDNDGRPNFPGTSAAAPHAAAVAALMIEAAGGPGSLTPAQIYSVMEQTSRNMGPAGYDFLTGFGLIDAQAAVAQVAQAPQEELDFFFAGKTSGNQTELYQSDGTSSGTSVVRNLGGATSANPQDLSFFNNFLYFSADVGNGQRELHRSNGTSASTGLVANLNGNASSDPREFIVFRNRLYFSAATGGSQRELFKSGGTVASTELVRNLSGTRSANPTEFTVAGNKMYFVATMADGQRELHVTDGTSAGTKLVHDLGGAFSTRPTDLVAIGSNVYFSGLLPSGERELFVSNGTSAGTKLVRNIAGTMSGSVSQLTAVGNRLYFSARLANGELELWTSLGTAASTVAVANLGGTRSSQPQWLTRFGNKLIFVATQSNGQRELMITSGTAATTRLLNDLSGTANSSPALLTPVGNKIAFSARLADGTRELHVTDGTAAGTRLVRNLAGSQSSSPSELHAVGDQLAFSALISSGERELWLSDLTAAGTRAVGNLNGTSSLSPTQMTPRPSTGVMSFAVDAGVASFANLLPDSGDMFSFALLDADEFLDVSRDGEITALDALQIVNVLATHSATVIGAEGENVSEVSDNDTEPVDSRLWFDVNLDGRVSSLDALVIINRLATDQLFVSSNDEIDIAMASDLLPVMTADPSDEEPDTFALMTDDDDFFVPDEWEISDSAATGGTSEVTEGEGEGEGEAGNEAKSTPSAGELVDAALSELNLELISG